MEFKNFVSSYKFKLSLHRIKYKLNQEDMGDFPLIKSYFLLLLENNKLENDLYYLETIKGIFPLLSSKERMNVLQNIREQKNCTPLEIEEIQKIINNLNS